VLVLSLELGKWVSCAGLVQVTGSPLVLCWGKPEQLLLDRLSLLLCESSLAGGVCISEIGFEDS